MLELKNVYAGYGGDDIVKNISFRVKSGENLCILGPNGCGKTTLLKAAAGLIPMRGVAKIDGVSTRDMSRRELSTRIGMLPQILNIYFSYTVFETVMMGRYIHMKSGVFKAPSKADAEIVEGCLDAVGMKNERGKDISRLSGGQLQRVFLARTLAQEPNIIMLDEPTNHLDLKYQVELVDYLKKWSQNSGHSVIGVMHDLNLAFRLADKFLLMKDGRAEAAGRIGEILDSGLLNRVYGIDVAGYMRGSLSRWEDTDGPYPIARG